MQSLSLSDNHHTNSLPGKWRHTFTRREIRSRINNGVVKRELESAFIMISWSFNSQSVPEHVDLALNPLLIVGPLTLHLLFA